MRCSIRVIQEPQFSPKRPCTRCAQSSGLAEERQPGSASSLASSWRMVSLQGGPGKNRLIGTPSDAHCHRQCPKTHHCRSDCRYLDRQSEEVLTKTDSFLWQASVAWTITPVATRMVMTTTNMK